MPELPSFNTIIVTKIDNPAGLKVGQIQFNRPDVLNALNIELMGELVNGLEILDKDKEIGCIIITGNAKAFAAGADIKEMATQSAIDMHVRDQFAVWDNKETYHCRCIRICTWRRMRAFNVMRYDSSRRICKVRAA